MNAPLDAAAVVAQAVARSGNSPTPDRRRPLHRELPPAPVYPLDALGNLRHAAEAVHALTQAPVAMCAQSVLAAATLAIQPHFDVDLPGGGRRPLTGIFASIAESGERKSTVDRHALRPVYEAEKRWGDAADAAMERHKIDHAAWSGARESAKRSSKGNRAALAKQLEEIGPEPKAPPSPMLLVGDTSPEGLVLHLATGRPWGGLFTAEGGLLIGGTAFNDEARMRTGALLNTLWDGDAIRRRRVGTGTTYLPGRRCTAHVMMQGVVANRLLGDADLDGIGLLARVLLVAPESTAGTRLFRDPSAADLSALDTYRTTMDALLERTPRTRDGNPDALDPHPLPLSLAARRLFIGFHDHVERAMGAAGSLVTIRAFAAKMAEHAGRIAAVMAVYSDPTAREVSAETMAGGIELAQHYGAEMMRLKGGAAVAPDLRTAARLLEWLQGRPSPRVHLAEIYQGLSVIGDASTARRIVAVLEDHGWVTRLPAGTEIDSAARKEAWELVP